MSTTAAPDDILHLLGWGVTHDVLTREQAQLVARMYWPAAGHDCTSLAQEEGLTADALRSRCHRSVERLTLAVTQHRAERRRNEGNP